MRPSSDEMRLIASEDPDAGTLQENLDSRELGIQDGAYPPRRYLPRRGTVAGSVIVVALVCWCMAWFSSRPSAASEDDHADGERGEAIELAGMEGGGNPNIVPEGPGPDAPLPKVWQHLFGQVFDDEGASVGELNNALQVCMDRCDASPTCNSFSKCGGNCFLKDKVQDGHGPAKANSYCESWFKSNEYFPLNPSLLQKNPDDYFEFYVYRVQTGPAYPPANTNAASIGGVMWYLHNEVIKTCDGSGFLASGGLPGERKFSINRLRRMKIRMKPTMPLKNAGMNFGLLQSFDSGETTGPHLGTTAAGVGTGFYSDREWDRMGYHMGCGKIGSWPHDKEPGGWTSGPHYPNSVWYSLPGPCPEEPYSTQAEWCEIEHPGGMCDYSTPGNPTGQGNCTWTYEEAGEIDIDELVGITPKWVNRKAFCDECAGEGGPWPGSWSPKASCNFHWWGNGDIWHEDAGNAKRVQAALDMFHTKFPDLPKESDMTPPPCDFNKATYQRLGGATFP